MNPEEAIDALRQFAYAHAEWQALKMVNQAARICEERIHEDSMCRLAEITKESPAPAQARAAAKELLTALLGRTPTEDELVRANEALDS
jgi:hypothetical protein